MAVYFLFDGGYYKRGVDDGRMRVPLTTEEIHKVVFDPHLTTDTDNSIKTELNFANYKDLYKEVKLNDIIYIGLAPGNAVYRGIWAGMFKAPKHFTFSLGVVRAKDVYEDIQAGNEGNLPGLLDNDGHVSISHTWVGDSPCDAEQKAKLTGKPYLNYRDPEGFKIKMFPADSVITAGLDGALYLKLLVTWNDPNQEESGECCAACGDIIYPHFEAGLIVDRLCFSSQRTIVPCSTCQDCGC